MIINMNVNINHSDSNWYDNNRYDDNKYGNNNYRYQCKFIFFKHQNFINCNLKFKFRIYFFRRNIEVMIAMQIMILMAHVRTIMTE